MKNIKQEVFKTLIEIIDDIADEEVATKININTPIVVAYDRLPLDSLDVIEVIVRLEKHYGISIRDDKLQKNVKTFNELCDLAVEGIIEKQKASLFYRAKQLLLQKIRK